MAGIRLVPMPRQNTFVSLGKYPLVDKTEISERPCAWNAPMSAPRLAHRRAFVAVAQARSFTRAAARLGMWRSASSQAMTALQARLGVRLLARTKRSVATSDAGARLPGTLTPMFNALDAESTSLRSLGDKPAGSVRITVTDHAIVTMLWPRLRELAGRYPDVQVESSVDYGLADIVQADIEAGRSVPVLDDWWPRVPGLHLYYTGRRQVAPALALAIEALGYRG